MADHSYRIVCSCGTKFATLHAWRCHAGLAEARGGSNKARVLESHPDAFARNPYSDVWEVLYDCKVQGVGSSARQAWHDAARFRGADAPSTPEKQ